MTVRLISLMLLAGLVGGCSLFDREEEKKPSPLVDFDSTLSVREAWSGKIGEGSEVPFPGLRPGFAGGKVFAAAPGGQVKAVNPENGRNVWTRDLELPLGAGPGLGEDLAVVGTVDGEVFALDQATGATVWRARVSSEVLGTPAVDAGVVVVRALDGRVFGFDASNGQRIWVHDSSVPLLTLRGNSSPVAYGGFAYVGFDSGEIASIRVRDGTLVWKQPVAKPSGRTELERIIDIDGRVEIIAGDIYVVTYQGLLAALTSDSGRLLWVKDLSSHAGLTAARNQVNISDADDAIWALDRHSGGTLWKQDRLARRLISGPARHGDHVAVGDFEGYVHWVSDDDGRFVARRRAGGSSIVAAPLVVGDMLLVQNSDAQLTAFRLP